MVSTFCDMPVTVSKKGEKQEPTLWMVITSQMKNKKKRMKGLRPLYQMINVPIPFPTDKNTRKSVNVPFIPAPSLDVT